MLFRKPIGEKTVAENLRKWGTGGLRRLSRERPFPEVVPSGRTPKREEAISSHPCLKPQHFMRVIVRALLPLGEGTVLDPFMGSGSTIAAAEAIGYRSVGIEIDQEYFRLAESAIPRLAALYPGVQGEELDFDSSDHPTVSAETPQLIMALAEAPGRYRVQRRGR
jgi:site-specific DNA-methyltransferase (adenine-specific)